MDTKHLCRWLLSPTVTCSPLFLLLALISCLFIANSTHMSFGSSRAAVVETRYDTDDAPAAANKIANIRNADTFTLSGLSAVNVGNQQQNTAPIASTVVNSVTRVSDDFIPPMFGEQSKAPIECDSASGTIDGVSLKRLDGMNLFYPIFQTRNGDGQGLGAEPGDHGAGGFQRRLYEVLIANNPVPEGQKMHLFVDVGVFHGWYGVSPLSLGHACIFVEPLCRHAKRMEVIRRVNGLSHRAQVFHGGAGETTSVKSLFTGAGRLHMDPNDRSPGDVEVKVRQFALDDILLNHTAKLILFVKIDADSHDARVIKGALQILATKRIRFLKVEFCPIALASNTGDPEAGFHLLQSLTERGYAVYEWGLDLKCNAGQAPRELNTVEQQKAFVHDLTKGGRGAGDQKDIFAVVNGGAFPSYVCL